jgi:hypothetical protein
MIADGVREKAAKLLGENPLMLNQHLAEQLGVSWGTARKLRYQIANPEAADEPRGEDNDHADTAADPDEETDGAWEIKLTVCANDMDRIFGGATTQEKTEAIANLLQSRLDAMLEAPKSTEES